jgi:hypothetical protein
MTICPRCSAELGVCLTNCNACGLRVGDGSAETAVLPSDPQVDTPTRIEVTHKKNKAVTTSSSGRFVSGTVLAGRYRIAGLIGKGGMGEVYKAEDLELDQTVALKLLPEELSKDEELLMRFRGEVRTARQVSHRNVCRVFDIGETQGQYYLTMEHVDGDDLSMLLRRIGRLPSDKGIDIARQICYGLEAIHKADILHRDLKPANIIIDSRGEARITDFGIAAIEADLDGGEIRIGTPAYMSPEQMNGGKLTSRSDIYSLGLVLYEIFTGKPAFTGDSLPELIAKRASTTPTSPSAIVAGIDPLVERVIERCLHENESERPRSALQVALSLPGGDPIQAAIAAGETPSPEMVAAAPKKGALRPAVALALLGGVIASFAFLAYFSYPVKFFGWLPLKKSPDVLVERAKDITKKLGYTDPPADSAYDFDYFRFYSSYIQRHEKTEPAGSWINSTDWRERLKTGQPEELIFWYRQSPSPFSRYGDTDVDYFHPSAEGTAGMVRVKTDVVGRLMEFTAVPPQIEKETTRQISTDWSAVFVEAGLDIANYRPTEPRWTPWTYADERAAWDGSLVDNADIPVRIEASAYQGRPVWFKVITPWEPPYRELSSLPIGSSASIGFTIFRTLVVLILIAGIFVARYNYKAGRADNSGALKLLVFVFTASLLQLILVEPHFSSSVFSLRFIRESVGEALFASITTWIAYLAIEPFIRKHWPSLSVSWLRLLGGDWRDPLVGRDILVGSLIGLLHTTAIYFLTFWSKGLTFGSSGPLTGWRGIFGGLGSTLAFPVFVMSLTYLLIIILTVIFRRRWPAIAILWVLHVVVLAFIFFGAFRFQTITGAAIIATIMLIPQLRFGMLAFVAYFITFNLTNSSPLTTDTSAFYFNVTVFYGIVIIGLAAFGFYTSLAGQPIFASKLSIAPEPEKA